MDYRHRPAKNIERYFIVDIARRLLVQHPDDYQYVGLGAFEFIDFQLFHRALGVHNMFSIERDPIERAEFNKPFKTIKVLHDSTGDALRSGAFDLGRPTIIWLDYTDKLNADVLSDVQEIGRNICAPSLVVFSINGQPRMSSPNDLHGNPVSNRRVEAMKEDIGAERIASDLSDDDLAGRGFAKLQREILGADFTSAVAARFDAPRVQQVLNLHYRDGALMQTVAWVCLPSSTSGPAARRLFKGLDFCRFGDDYLDLRVPVITPRERQAIDQKLPRRSRRPFSIPNLPESEVEAYRGMYRYLHFAGLQSAVETTWTD